MEIFNEKYDKIRFEDLSVDLQKLITEASDVVSYDLDKHVQDKKVHISNLDRDNWNNKAPNESPHFTGVPTSPTPILGDSSNKISTTEFINNTLKTFKPTLADKANSLNKTINVSLTGGVSSSVVEFNGTKDLIIPVDEVNVSAIRGILPTELLAGTYQISISGNANHALTADNISGVELNEIALKDSPALEGKPTAPTAAFGTATDQLATTKFVDKAIKAIDMDAIADDVSTKVKFKPYTLKLDGKAKSDVVTINGENTTISITELIMDYNDIANNVNITRVNGHTVNKDVPANAVFTDTVYTHPNTATDISNQEFMTVTVDRQGHVISGRNPNTLNVNITKNAATATKLAAPKNIGLTGVTATAASFDGSANVNINVTAIPAALITEDENHKFLTTAEKERIITNGITAAEVDSKIQAIKSGMEWKESVATVADLSKTYPTPSKGWTVNVDEDNNTYRYDGSKWVAISANAIPLASTAVDGKMSKEDKAKLDGIEAGANNYVLPSTLPATMITEDENHKFLTKEMNEKLANSYSRNEIDSAFVTKTDLANRPNVSIGGGWTLEPNESGTLIFKFNGVEKASLGTDGRFKSISLEEVGG